MSHNSSKCFTLTLRPWILSILYTCLKPWLAVILSKRKKIFLTGIIRSRCKLRAKTSMWIFKGLPNSITSRLSINAYYPTPSHNKAKRSSKSPLCWPPKSLNSSTPSTSPKPSRISSTLSPKSICSWKNSNSTAIKSPQNSFPEWTNSLKCILVVW